MKNKQQTTGYSFSRHSQKIWIAVVFMFRIEFDLRQTQLNPNNPFFLT